MELKEHAGVTTRCLYTAQLFGAEKLRARGDAETAEQAHAALVADARELHAALGPWIGEHTPVDPTRDPLLEEYAHEVDIDEVSRFNGGAPFVEFVAYLNDGGCDAGIEGHGRTRKTALESLRVALVKRQASEWAAYARALKGGE